ncbi:MAG: plasmid pRiA4b ORF-3 family protein [Candidatus Thermoplasmatota archaeon]|nr:plasmid pRiA4b ORF-3 family protein [Candidatus Thermoplasmatota archaeon]
MGRKDSNIYQFKIVLNRSKPPIWRRIQVPETYSFYDLHVAIQSSFQWADYHLHEFEIFSPRLDRIVNIGMAGEDYGEEILSEQTEKIKHYFSMEHQRSHYIYDFGDYWEHIITLEKILPRKKEETYPRCVKGKRACPPEDSGGIWGYEEFLEAINDSNHEKHEAMKQWYGGEFDSAYFDKDDIIFADPKKHLQLRMHMC